MPTKKVTFPLVRFPPETIEAAFARFTEALAAQASGSGSDSADPVYRSMSVQRGTTRWTFDTSDEFLADIRQPYDLGTVDFRGVGVMSTLEITVDIYINPGDTNVIVKHPDRAGVERLMAPFEGAAPALVRDPPPPRAVARPRVFIGHGGVSTGWRDVKDHLHDFHGYEVEAYQSGARAGHTIRDILDEMLNASTFAILVMSAEDEQADGTLRARENVVHEAGLFQGRLGFSKTVILLEEGVGMFSNLDGIQYISYSRNNIRETFGDVLATLRREFPS